MERGAATLRRVGDDQRCAAIARISRGECNGDRTHRACRKLRAERATRDGAERKLARVTPLRGWHGNAGDRQCLVDLKIEVLYGGALLDLGYGKRRRKLHLAYAVVVVGEKEIPRDVDGDIVQQGQCGQSAIAVVTWSSRSRDVEIARCVQDYIGWRIEGILRRICSIAVVTIVPLPAIVERFPPEIRRIRLLAASAI